MPAQQQGSGGQEGSMDFLWIIGMFIGVIYLIWYFGHEHISVFLFTVRYYEIVAVKLVLAPLQQLLAAFGVFQLKFDVVNQLVATIAKDIITKGSGFEKVYLVGQSVGEYTRYPIALLLLAGAAFLNLNTVAHKLHNVFDAKSLRKSEQEDWPIIRPVVNLDLVKQQLDEGPWAISLSPMRFCKKNNLLDIVQKNGKYVATLKKGPAYRMFSLQIGPRWLGAEALPMYLKALFAIFAARLNEDKKSAEQMIDQIAFSATSGNLNFAGVEELLHKHMHSKRVAKITSVHGYVTTVLASMLVGARSIGVLASAEFIWLKPLDRHMWYMLNGVGRQTSVIEICGAYAHWLAEKKLGLPLMVPMVEEAVRGVENALSELLYVPEEDADK